MALTTLQCKNCGAHLEIDPNTASYVCPNCNTPYAVEQTFTQTIQNTVIQGAQTVTVIDDGSAKLLQAINNAETRIRMGEYELAQRQFKELTNKYAQDHRIWLGLARAISHNFSQKPKGKREYESICDALWRARITSEGDKTAQAEIQESSAAYLAQWEAYSKSLVAQRNQKAEENKIREEELCAPKQKQIDDIQATVEKKKTKLEKMEKIGKKIPRIAFLTLSALLFFVIIIIGFKNIHHIGDIISTLWTCVLMGALFVWLPLKLIFSFVINSLRVSTEMMINSSNVKMTQIKSEIRQIQDQLKNELYTVLENTDWLDH